MNDKPKILFIDIEWEPAQAYVWRMWDENISPAQLIDKGGMLCFCAHWQGSREFLFYSKWKDGRPAMAQAALELLTEADAVIGYNSDKYDLPKIMGEILLAGLNPPPIPTSIDLMKTIKKMGFVMNRLAYIAPLLGIGGKVEAGGFDLWKKVMAGDERAQRKMERYCKQDVRLLPRLYNKIKPFIRNHPHLGSVEGDACGACGSHHVQKRGTRRTKYFVIQNLQCQTCGSWSSGTRKKIILKNGTD